MGRLQWLLDVATEKLSPTHFLVLEIYKMLSTIFASLAVSLEARIPPGKISSFRKEACRTGLRIIKILECAQARCGKSISCTIDHPILSHSTESIMGVYGRIKMW